MLSIANFDSLRLSSLTQSSSTLTVLKQDRSLNIVVSPSALENVATLNGEPLPSTIVELSAESAPALTYLSPQIAVVPKTTVWESEKNDSISSQMGANVTAYRLSDRFNGLGKALLGRFATSAENYKQSVVSFSSGLQGTQNTEKARGDAFSELSNNPDAKITLSFKTQLGTTVELNIVSGEDGLGVEVTSSAELSLSEREALTKLSDGFEQAIQGMTEQPPRIDLGGLLQFDTSVLTSLDLSASFKTDDSEVFSLSFQADEKQRSLSAKTPLGQVSLQIDMTASAFRGGLAQKYKAIGNYLSQVDLAAEHGKADASLIAMFKDAFSAMHGASAADSAQTDKTSAPAEPVHELNDADKALLTGLADFEASISATPLASNPMRPNEIDLFSYQLSQTTKLSTGNIAQLTQRQESHLSASFHQSLTSSVSPQLTTEKRSQNYRFFEVEEQASSQATIVYDQEKLIAANLSQSSVQMTKVKTYKQGVVVDEQQLPAQKSIVRDLLATMRYLQSRESKEDPRERRRALEGVNDQVFLNALASD